MESEREVNERDDFQARRFVLDLGWERSQRQAVDEHDRVVGDGRQHAGRVRERRGGRTRKGAGELPHVHQPAPLAQAGDHATVVLVAAGPRVETPGNNHGECLRGFQ